MRPEQQEPSEAKVRRGELWRTSKDDLFAHINTNKIPLVGPQIKHQAPNKQDLIDSILAWEAKKNQGAQGAGGRQGSEPRSLVMQVAGGFKKPHELTVDEYETYSGEFRELRGRWPDKVHREVVEQALSEGKPVSAKVLEAYPDLAQAGGGGKMMKTHVTQTLGGLVKSLELQGLTAGLGGLIAKGAACPPDAVPLEQLKGDLARAGHPVKRAIALDAENRRLFFIDNTDTYLFAEYGSPEVGFSLGRVGSQSEVAKDYDPVDLEPEPRSDVETGHDEEEQGDDPGFVPSGTPGVKPTDADGRGFGKALKASLDRVCGCLKDQGR